MERRGAEHDVGLGQRPTAGDMPSVAHMLWSLVDRRQPLDRHHLHHQAERWGRYLGDTTVTAAVLDRLEVTSLQINIDEVVLLSRRLAAMPRTH